jgi:hypothetical protein
MPNKKRVAFVVLGAGLLILAAIKAGTSVADFWSAHEEAIAFALADPERVVEAKVAYKEIQKNGVRTYKSALSRVFVEEE